MPCGAFAFPTVLARKVFMKDILVIATKAKRTGEFEPIFFKKRRT